MNTPSDAIILSGVRTPFSMFGSILRDMHSMEIGIIVIKSCLEHASPNGDDLDELYYGMCIQSEATLNYNVIGRQPF
jgi:acetyl-CoA C-acetyltransferase